MTEDTHNTAGGLNQDRILLVAATFPPTRCGVGDYSRKLSSQLSEAGHEMHILTGSAQDPEHQHAAPESMGPVGAATHPAAGALPMAEARVDDLRVYRAVESWDWQAQAWFEGALQQIQPRVVSLQYHGEDFLLHPAVCMFAEIAARYAVPVVTTFHNLQKPRGWTHGREPLEWLLQTSQRWITTNELDRQEMAALPEATEKLRLVPAGPNIASPAPSTMAGNAAGPLRLTYFGFLNPVKGIEHLLEALAHLRSQDIRVHLTLAAGIHTDATSRLRDYAQFIDQEIARHNLTEQVQRIGFLEEQALSQLLQETDLAVFPFRDGLSDKNGSFWTALEHATPALTTQGAGLPDGLQHERNVLLAPIDDSDKLASCMRWAAENRQLLPDIGTAGQRYVRERLDWSRLAHNIHSIFTECFAEVER